MMIVIPPHVSIDYQTSDVLSSEYSPSVYFRLDNTEMFGIVDSMQITREGDYGIRSVLYLARQPYNKISYVNEISEEYNIPRSFLAKILQKLVKAKIVRSYRGVKGGFSLARPAREISMMDVLEAVEGKLYLNICLMDKKKCGFSKHCPVHSVWVNAQSKVAEVLKKANFDDLAKQKA